MFSSGYWVFPEINDERVCYAKAPTFHCPVWHGLDRPVAAALAEGARPAPPIDDAASLLGLSAESLRKILVRAHRSSHATRLRVDGKLTDICATCGAKLDRLGYRCWIERLVPEEELTAGQRTAAHISGRLGGDGQTWQTVTSIYLDTKREAAQWARDEYQTRKRAATEAVT